MSPTKKSISKEEGSLGVTWSSLKGCAPMSSSFACFLLNQKCHKNSNAANRLDFPLAFAP